MFKFKKIALAASIFTATALSLAAFAACGEPVKGDKGDKGDKGETGATGATGAAGQDGKDGVGIEDIKPGEDGKLIITMTDGTKKEVAMPTVDAPVAEEHTLTKDPITIIDTNGEAGQLDPGQTGIGLYYCTDCGDVFAKSAHAHNLTAWAKIATDTTGMTYERDCLVFKNGFNGDTEKVADEHQTIKMISYSDVVAADGSLKEGWKKEANGDYTKKAEDTNGLWVVSVALQPQCNAEGKAKIVYLTADGPEATTNTTYTNYKNTAIVLDGTASNLTDAQKEATKVPVTGHYFDITNGKIIFEGKYPTVTVDGQSVRKTADQLTGADVEAAVAATTSDAQGDNNTIKEGYNKAAYFVICSNCGGSAADKAVKVFDTVVTNEVTQVANCANKQLTKITATMNIVAGGKTFTKTAVIEGVETGAATAPTGVTGHVYNVYDADGAVVAYYNGVKYYKSTEIKTENEIPAPVGATLYRKEGSVVAVNCANCSGGRIAYDIPTTVLTTLGVWTQETYTAPTEAAEGKVTYSHDFGIIDGDADKFVTAEIKIAKLAHKNVFKKAGTADEINPAAAKVGDAVDVSCGNAGDASYGVSNEQKANELNVNKKYNTVEITAIEKAVTQNQTCTLPEITTYTVTVTAYTQKLDEADRPVYDGKTGAPVWDTSKTKTYTQTYNVETKAAADHKKAGKTAYVETVVAYPTATELGLLEYKCSLCGDVYYYVLPSINSNPTNNMVNTVDTAVTCTTDGFTTYTSKYINTANTVLDGKTYAVDNAGTANVDESKVSFKKEGEAALGHEMGAWKAATGTGTNYKWIRQCARVQANGTLDGYYEVSNADSNPDAE